MKSIVEQHKIKGTKRRQTTTNNYTVEQDDRDQKGVDNSKQMISEGIKWDNMGQTTRKETQGDKRDKKETWINKGKEINEKKRIK